MLDKRFWLINLLVVPILILAMICDRTLSDQPILTNPFLNLRFLSVFCLGHLTGLIMCTMKETRNELDSKSS